MENINYTTLICNDSKRFRAMMGSLEFDHVDVKFEVGKVYIQSTDHYPEEDIKQLSAENPDLIFTARCTFYEEKNEIDHIIEFKGGKSKETGLEASYKILSNENEGFERIDYILSYMNGSFSLLYDKAIEIFRRIDIMKEDEKGRKYFDFVSDITLMVEDEDFQLHLSKYGSFIRITNCYEKIEETTIRLAPIEDAPFA